MMSGRAAKPKIIVRTFICRSIINPISNNVAKNTRAALTDTAPLAIGRFLVRSTILSRSRSHKSLMTQPAARMIIAPKVNRAIM